MKKNLYNTHTRRFFLKQAGSFSALAIMAPSALTAGAQEKFKLGLQLYTIRDAMAKDYWGLEPKQAERLLTECGLTATCR
jgi:hypothetical protein